MLGDSLFSSLSTNEGATSLTILMILVCASMLMISLTGLPIFTIIKNFIALIGRIFGKFINKKEQTYHRDIEIGKINEKRAKVKLYNFLSELIIDLNMTQSGLTPYELLAITCILVIFVTSIICKMLFGTIIMAIPMTPIAIV
ncbi:MAG: hypothetical protein J6A59_13255, partial [Lachnospiraceae bacterium]|nr:hypothetical protein [Lachnospiraceae bacterium]